MKLHRRLCTILLSLGLVVSTANLLQHEPAAAEPPVSASGDGIDTGVELRDIANRGEAGWLRYRIPSLTQLNNGDIIAIYDGRPTMADLPSNITLLMRRSTDGGDTWGPQMIIRQEAAPNGFGDPSVLVDRDTGRVFVFYAASINAGFGSSTIGQRDDDPNVLHADYSVSDDDGATWTHHRITSDIKQGRAWAGMFAASGEGIQLRHGAHAGRLIQQYTVRIIGENYAVSVYSDDGGASWKTSRPVGPGADENKTVELSNGDVLLNSRAAPYRRIATSTDGGATYTDFSQDTELPDPANNGSIIRAWPDAPASDPRSKVLLFSNTANQLVRRNLTVRMSCDDGRTWPVSKVVQSGAVGYSTLTALTDGNGERGGNVGLFYERDGYRHLSFTRLNLDWLDGVCGSLSVEPAATYSGGVATPTSVTITNQSADELASGTVAIAEGQRFTSPDVTVPAIAAGQSVSVIVHVTADDTADTRTHDVAFRYTNPAGSASTSAGLDTVADSFIPDPGLTIRPVIDALYPDEQPGLLGDRVQPWVEVINTGNVTLDNIAFTAPAGADVCNYSMLAPGASYACKNNGPSHTITSADLLAGVWTTAYTATAMGAGQSITANAALHPVLLDEAVPEPTASATAPSSSTATATASATVTATVTATATTTATASSSATATVTMTPSQTVVPTTPVPTTSGPVDVYTTPGLHFVNGRHWSTTCEPYSQTVRCRTEIWSKEVQVRGGRFVTDTGWHFNNLTYLPSARSLWKGNPLGNTGKWTDASGRAWMTECDTPRTGRNGCRTWIRSDVVQATAKPGGGYSYALVSKFVFNNLVLFG